MSSASGLLNPARVMKTQELIRSLADQIDHSPLIILRPTDENDPRNSDPDPGESSLICRKLRSC